MILDTGEPGTWRDCIANSPCLKVSDYAGCRRSESDGFSAPVPFNHVQPISAEAQPQS